MNDSRIMDYQSSKSIFLQMNTYLYNYKEKMGFLLLFIKKVFFFLEHKLQ